jgi:DNA-binding GntR family transcriptional regulator
MDLDLNKKKAKVSNLSEHAYEIIKDKIVKGDLSSSDVISISAIAESLNISRTPVSNACQKLEKEGFLRIIPKQGVIINVLSINDAREIYELRTAIETYAAKNITDKFNDTDYDILRQMIEKQRIAVKNNDIYNFMIEDTKFHKYFLSKFDNSQFIATTQNLYDRAFQLGLKVCSNSNRLLESFKEHEKIIEYLKSGDKQAFIDAIESNIMNGCKSFMDR